jgi:hypothetical protein
MQRQTSTGCVAPKSAAVRAPTSARPVEGKRIGPRVPPRSCRALGEMSSPGGHDTRRKQSIASRGFDALGRQRSTAGYLQPTDSSDAGLCCCFCAAMPASLRRFRYGRIDRRRADCCWCPKESGECFLLKPFAGDSTHSFIHNSWESLKQKG